MKRHPVALIFRKLKIKVTMRSYSICTKVAQDKEKTVLKASTDPVSESISSMWSVWLAGVWKSKIVWKTLPQILANVKTKDNLDESQSIVVRKIRFKSCETVLPFRQGKNWPSWSVVKSNDDWYLGEVIEKGKRKFCSPSGSCYLDLPMYACTYVSICIYVCAG